MLVVSVWLFIDMSTPWVPAAVLVPVGLIPAVRMGEGVQARLLLTPGEQDSGISVNPSATWRDRLRTVLWLEVRMGLGAVAMASCVWLPALVYDLVRIALGHAPGNGFPLLSEAQPHWTYALLVPLPLLALYVLVFVAAMSIFPKKFNRYIEPVFPALDILGPQSRAVVACTGGASGQGEALSASWRPSRA